MPTLITIKGISNKKYNASEFIKVPIYFKGFNSSGKARTTIISRKFYIINNLLVKALITVDILKPKRIVINFSDNTIKLGSY